MRIIISALALLAVIGMGAITSASAADGDNSPAARMASFEACMVEAGFVKDQDFQTRLNTRTVAGSEVPTSYSVRAQGYVINTPDLLAKYNGCRTANGLPEKTA